MKVTLKHIVDIMAQTGASENETQNATARFNTCTGDDERETLLSELSKRKSTAAAEPVEPEPTEPVKTITDEGQNKGGAASVKASKAALEYAEEHGINLAEVPSGPNGKIDLKEVKAFHNKNKDGE